MEGGKEGGRTGGREREIERERGVFLCNESEMD